MSIGSVLFTGLVMFVECVDGSPSQIESIKTLLGKTVRYRDPNFGLLEGRHGLSWSRSIAVPPTTSVNPSYRLEIRSKHKKTYQ